MFSALGKFTVLTFGLIGSFLALIILVLWGSIHTLIGAFNDSPAGPNRIGWGLLLIGIAVVASFLSIFLSRITSILFLIAGIGLFWVISGWAIIPLIFFVIAAAFDFLGRSRN
jgi:hypothetical protein